MKGLGNAAFSFSKLPYLKGTYLSFSLGPLLYRDSRHGPQYHRGLEIPLFGLGRSGGTSPSRLGIRRDTVPFRPWYASKSITDLSFRSFLLSGIVRAFFLLLENLQIAKVGGYSYNFGYSEGSL